MRPPAVLLAGGKASRMGGVDKPLQRLGDRPILAHVIERLKPQVAALVLNANGDPARFAASELPVIADLIPGGLGPLAGIHAGLVWARARYPGRSHLVSVPADLPFLPADLVARLTAGLNDADIVMAETAGRPHPAVALWPLALADELALALAEDGPRKVTAFAGRYRVAFADFPVTGLDPFFNINTPDDLRAAQTYV